jgi:hypothetical protein
MRYRLHAAFLLSMFFFLWAAFRPLSLNHDTSLYVEQVEAYFVNDGVRFPDIFFNGMASAIAVVFDQVPGGREISGRFFLVCIALIQSVLLFIILRKKRRIIEATLLAFSFGPLIFLDIIRQGMAMLLAGVFFSGKNHRFWLMVGSLSTHIVSVISILLLPLNKKNWKILVLSLCFFLIALVVLRDDLLARYEYYLRTAGYLLGIEDLDVQSILDIYSVSNLFVLLFFVFGNLVGAFTRVEAIIFFVLYVVSIYIPLFYRFYLFYFFCVSCSRDMLMSSKQITGLMFNVAYAVILLRFSLNAFDLPPFAIPLISWKSSLRLI